MIELKSRRILKHLEELAGMWMHTINLGQRNIMSCICTMQWNKVTSLLQKFLKLQMYNFDLVSNHAWLIKLCKTASHCSLRYSVQKENNAVVNVFHDIYTVSRRKTPYIETWHSSLLGFHLRLIQSDYECFRKNINSKFSALLCLPLTTSRLIECQKITKSEWSCSFQ